MNRRKNAFTLVELLVVVSIIALLIAILLPSLKKARDQAKRVSCASNLRMINTAMLTYAVENKDFIPRNRGAEPTYCYVRGTSSREWHLGELLMPQMNMDPMRRGTDGAPANRFSDEELARTAEAGEVFYCPATKNGKNLDPRFPTWRYPTTYGSFMDYAQYWGYVPPDSETQISANGIIIPVRSGYVVFDDEFNQLRDELSGGFGLYRLPVNTSRRDFVRLPNSGPASQVPLFSDYMRSRNIQKEQYAGAYAAGDLTPTDGNHRWTGRAGGAGKVPVIGGNYGYVDGHVEWRTPSGLRPRLLIDRVFQGGGAQYPCYWW